MAYFDETALKVCFFVLTVETEVPLWLKRDCMWDEVEVECWEAAVLCACALTNQIFSVHLSAFMTLLDLVHYLGELILWQSHPTLRRIEQSSVNREGNTIRANIDALQLRRPLVKRTETTPHDVLVQLSVRHLLKNLRLIEISQPSPNIFSIIATKPHTALIVPLIGQVKTEHIVVKDSLFVELTDKVEVAILTRGIR